MAGCAEPMSNAGLVSRLLHGILQRVVWRTGYTRPRSGKGLFFEAVRPFAPKAIGPSALDACGPSIERP
jgi:hypothetical protein